LALEGQRRASVDRNSYYAYGWDVHKTADHRLLIQHNGYNGYNGSFYADFFRFPHEGVTIISLSNKAEDRFCDINERVAQLMFPALS
jgi:hypothetical protein